MRRGDEMATVYKHVKINKDKATRLNDKVIRLPERVFEEMDRNKTQEYIDSRMKEIDDLMMKCKETPNEKPSR